MFTPAFELPEFVRVKDKVTKHEFTVVASTFDEEHMELLDKPAIYPNGTPLPAKHYIAPQALSSPSPPRPEGRSTRQGVVA